MLDASVALAWCFEDEASPYADRVIERLEDDQAVVPAIWALELGNALLAAERRERLRAAEIPRLLEILTALPIQVEPVALGQALGSVMELARQSGLSVYDAAYVDLAIRVGAPLATLDERLRDAATRAGAGVVD